MRAEPGSKYCAAHRGTADAKAAGLKNYHLAKSIIRRQAAKKANASGIKSLRDEIGITRSILETTLETCESEADLVLKAQTITQLVDKVERLVVSCHKLEDSLKLRLDKSQIIDIVKQMVETVNSTLSEYVDPDKLDDARDAVSKNCYQVLMAGEDMAEVL
jgi:methyl coenzyme M reductase alpha subunit